MIPDEWEANNEMGRQFFTNAAQSMEWELEFAADGKVRFVETTSGLEQEYPPWITSDEDATRVLRNEPWRVLWLKTALRDYQLQLHTSEEE